MEKMDSLLSFVSKNKKDFQLLIGILVVILIATEGLWGQNTEGFIYGKVYTQDNIYTGQLRWGKEEAYWHDHFNASKIGNEYAKYKDLYREKERDNDSWRNIDWRISSIWEDKAKTVHQFGCRFGDLQTIERYGNSRVTVKLKNGKDTELSGSGYNDIGTAIKVLDEELGEISIDWYRVRKVAFLPTPKNLKPVWGEPLYGKVSTYRKGDFEGFIIWDHDERLGGDKLDGDSRDGNLSIRFDNIRRIQKQRNGSLVDMRSGRQVYLSGSNDVNGSNRGIIVQVAGVGRVDIPWRDFVSLELEESKDSGEPYSSYTTPGGLSGKVIKYQGGEAKGDIVFDLDESLEIEFLEGKDDDIDYIIPFKNIKTIAPRNYNFSVVILKSGQELLLGDGRDVSESNSGIMIFTKENDDPQYVEWRNVTEIIFDK